MDKDFIIKFIKLFFLGMLLIWGGIGFVYNIFFTGDKAIGFGFGLYSIIALIGITKVLRK